MNENQTLELKVKAMAEEAKSGISKLANDVLKLGDSVQRVSTKVDSNGKLINKTITSVRKEGNKVYTTLKKIDSDGNLVSTTTTMKKLGTATKNTSSHFKSLLSVASFTGLYYGVKKLATTFLDWMSESTDRTEQLNLFNVIFKNIEKNGTTTFSKLGKSATQFQYKLNQAFGTNLTDTLKYQALFESMGENASIPRNYAGIMSETMTKFTYDLASLYNKEEKDVAEALRAGVYAGQTKPLRSYGIDVTQSTMQPLLVSLGITDREVSELSQGEKQILRYLATLKQAKVAMGDYANTVESPANQMKVFKNLLIESKVALTSLFMGTFTKILPYANALLLVIKGICNAISNMFGIKLSAYNSSVAGLGDAFSDLEDDVDDATGSVKELKRQTLGFDQINNLTENKDSGKLHDTMGGIDKRLLDAIYGYDNGMDEIKMKATEIYEKIMGWLGFMKQIDPITGEISWKLDSSNSTMGKILSSIKDILVNGKEAVEKVFKIMMNDFAKGDWGNAIVLVFEGIADAFKFINKNKTVQKILAKVLEILISIKALKMIPFLKNIISLVGSSLKTSIKGIVNVLTSTKNKVKEVGSEVDTTNSKVKENSKLVNENSTQTSGWAKVMDGAKTALSGLVTAGLGLYTVYESMKSIVDQGPNVTNVFSAIIGSLTTISGFATIGSIFGPVGTAIGAVVGVVATLTASLEAYGTQLHRSVEGTAESLQEWENTVSTAKSHLSDFNDSLFASDDEIQELQNNMADIQNKITAITELASRERRNYTDEEIRKLNEYFEELERLNDKQLEIQQAKANAILQQAKITAQNNQLSLEEYKQYASEWIATAIEQKDNMISIIEEQTTNELVLLNQRYGDEANLANEAYKKEYEEILKRKEEKINQATSEIGEIYALYTEGYLQRTGLDDKLNAHIKGNLKERESLEETFHSKMVEIMENENLTKEEKNKRATVLNDQYNKDMKRVNGEILQGYKNFIKELDDEEQKQLATLISMSVNTSLYGGKMSDETTGFVESIINVYGILPKKTKNVMENALSPMLTQMQEKEPLLFAKAKSLADGILKRLQTAFDIHSPSKKTKKIFHNVMMGMIEGIDSQKNNLLDKIDLLQKEVMKGITFTYEDIPNNLSIDLNKQINFKDLNNKIDGEISANINNDIAQNIGYYVAQAINSRPIEVDINATTDNGTILKTAVNGINQITNQTGICPITIPH